MGGLSDTMLGGNCVPLLENVHAETVTMLSGLDAGKKFLAINEVEIDIGFESELTSDPRGKRVLRFASGAPRAKKLDRIQTADGRKWTMTIRPSSAYLTTDYELAEIDKQDT